MAIELITGRAGTPHVDSADVGALNAALFGEGAYILEGITAELVDANNVLVSAGEMLCEGRHIRITGEGETLTIENGLSAYKRHDIIAAKYLRGEDGIETVTLVVIKGSNSSTAPQDPPMPRQGKVIDGASEAYWPLYRVVIDGLTPQAPVLIAEQQAVYTLGLGAEIPQDADLNDYLAPGIYRCSYDYQNVRNCPIDRGFVLVVEMSAFDYMRTQKIYPYWSGLGNGASWERGIAGRRPETRQFYEWVCTGGVDAIVAEGYDGTFKWIKYANGNCVLFGDKKVTVTSQEVWTYSHKSQTFGTAFPFPISGQRYVAISDGTASVQVLYASPTSAYIELFSGHNLVGYDFYITLAVFGEWK